jgi:hypothetical protein
MIAMPTSKRRITRHPMYITTLKDTVKEYHPPPPSRGSRRLPGHTVSLYEGESTRVCPSALLEVWACRVGSWPFWANVNYAARMLQVASSCTTGAMQALHISALIPMVCCYFGIQLLVAISTHLAFRSVLLSQESLPSLQA